MEDVTFEICSFVRGHHIYKEIWSPILGEELDCAKEEDNRNDRYAVSVVKNDAVVGHLPRRISAACSLFITRKGRITCVITGHRQYSVDLPQGGFDVPCRLIFKGENVGDIKKMTKLLIKEKLPQEKEPPCKKRNVATEFVSTGDGSESSRWLVHGDIEMFSEDKAVIISGGWLTDKHINYAQSLLKKQYNSISGLSSTLLVHRTTIPLSDAIQIINCKGNHWIVVTTIGCSSSNIIAVFDSLYTSIDSSTLEVITKIFNGKTKIVMQDGPKQNGTNDCGLFAIATATSLAFSHDIDSVRKVTYNQSLMREHLINCFEKITYHLILN